MGTRGILFNFFDKWVFLAYFKIAKFVKFSQLFAQKITNFVHKKKTHCSMSTESSVRDAARMVAGLDFGTTFSGFAFAHMSNPDHIYTFYDWHIQVKGGGRPCCKTIAALYYKSSS